MAISGKKNVVLASAPPLRAARCDGPLPLPDRCGGDECDDCGVRCGSDDCGPDPYASDVHNDNVPVLKCQACRHESAQDI